MILSTKISHHLFHKIFMIVFFFILIIIFIYAQTSSFLIYCISTIAFSVKLVI